MSEPTIERFDDIRRYLLRQDDEVIGHISYRDRGDRRVILHTIVDDAHTGKGFGTRLIVAALDDIRASGKRAVTVCSMAAAYVAKHPEYDDLVDPADPDDR